MVASVPELVGRHIGNPYRSASSSPTSALSSHGVWSTSVVDTIEATLWSKLLNNTRINALCALSGLAIGPTMADPWFRSVAVEMVKEGAAVAEELDVVHEHPRREHRVDVGVVDVDRPRTGGERQPGEEHDHRLLAGRERERADATRVMIE